MGGILFRTECQLRPPNQSLPVAISFFRTQVIFVYCFIKKQPMYKLLPFTALVLYTTFVCAQPGEIYKVQVGEMLPAKAIYTLPEFTSGTVTMRNGSVSRGLFNFNCFTGAMQFINTKGDTLEIADPGLIKTIQIDTFTFYYDKFYLQQVFNAGAYKIAVRQVLEELPDKITGGLGSGDISSADASEYSFVTFYGKHPLHADRNISVRKAVRYYIGDGYYNFIKADKKAFTDLFFRKRLAIEDFVKKNKTDFTNKNDLEKLLQFCLQ